MGRVRPYALTLAFLAYILLERRLFVRFETGGKGVLPYLDVVLPLLVALVGLISARRSFRFLRRRRFWFLCGVYAVLAIVYPFLGLATGNYSSRHLLAVLEGVLPISFFALGYALAADGARARVLLRRCLLGATLVQAAYALLQFANITGHLPSLIGTPLSAWDETSQLAYSGIYLVGRSSGLFVNPNELGFWAVIAFWGGILLFSGSRRVVAVTAALCTLFLSQSRGSLVALIGSVAIWSFYQAAITATDRRSSRRRGLADVAPAVSLSIGLLLILVVLSSSWTDVPVLAVMHQRLQSALAIISRGVSQDNNFATRLDVWSQVPRFMANYPLGTFGPPQVLFIAPIDNDYVRLLLQGGVPYLLACSGTLLYIISLIRSPRPEARFVAIATCALAINAITALPLTYSSVAVIWTFLGYTLFPQTLQRYRVSALPHVGRQAAVPATLLAGVTGSVRPT